MNEISTRRTQLLFAVALIAIDRLAAAVFGIHLLPGFATETGALALWAVAHCDTLDGPLVTLAKRALEEKNVNPVLAWVRREDEGEVRQAFEHAQAVRALGPDARALADRHFFETLVRIHRAGEGAAFTGLEPAGLDLGPAVPAADEALKTGSPEEVIKLLEEAVRAGVRARFRATTQRQGFEPNDIAAGREYVEAYVTYVHYVERLWDAATAEVHGHYPGHGAHPVEHAAHHHH